MLAKFKLILIFFLFVTSVFIYCNEGINYILDMDKIKKSYHLNNFHENNDYINQISLKELMEFGYELALSDVSGDSYMGLVGPIFEKLEEDNCSDYFVSLLKYRDYPADFHHFLLDISKHGVENYSNNYDKLNKLFWEIALDRKVELKVRQRALRSYEIENENGYIQFELLFYDPDYKNLQNEVLNCLIRLKHPKVQDIITEIINDYQQYIDDVTLILAIRFTAIEQYDVFTKIASEINSYKVYLECLSKLARFDNPDAVIAFFKIPCRFENERIQPQLNGIKYLWHSQNAIIEMLDTDNNDNYRIIALQAILKASIPFDKTILSKIKNIYIKSKNEELKRECMLTIDFLEALYEDPSFQKKNKMLKNRY